MFELPLPQQLQKTFGHPVSSVQRAPFFIESLFLTRATELLPKVNYGVLIKSSLNMQNIRDTSYKKVNPGRSHYPSLISLIKSIADTKEETQIKKKKLSLRKLF